MKFKIHRLTNTAIFPTKDNHKDAGWDLYADEDVIIEPGETKIVKTGIAIQPDNPDYFKIVFESIRERSGLASRSVRVGGGVVDEIFTGEVGVILQNLNIHHILNRLIFKGINTTDEMVNILKECNLKIKKGDKIAQFLPKEVVYAELEDVDGLEETSRGNKGFGSSDCRCTTHLFYFQRRPLLREIKNFILQKFPNDAPLRKYRFPPFSSTNS